MNIRVNQKSGLTTLLMLAMVSYSWAFSGGNNAKVEPVKTGTAAPDFTLTDSSGSTVSLGQFKGKTVVLEWYNKDCPYVRKHYDSQNMQGLQKKVTGDGGVWLTIISSAEGKQGYLTQAEAAAQKTQEKMAATHLLLDTKGEVGRKYGAMTTPQMVVIDGTGTISYRGAIDDKRGTSKEEVKSAKNYVVEALTALKAGNKVEVAETASYGCSVKY